MSAQLAVITRQLTALSGQVKAIAEQNTTNFRLLYNSHAVDTPQVFIILPAAADPARWRKPLDWGKDTFRLFLICECSCNPAEWHMVGEGYLLEEPTEFVKKVAPTLKVLLQLLKVTDIALNISGQDTIVGDVATGMEMVYDDKTASTTKEYTYLHSVLLKHIAELEEEDKTKRSEKEVQEAFEKDRDGVVARGASLREFRNWLKKMDPHQDFFGMTRHVVEQQEEFLLSDGSKHRRRAGELYWLCPRHASLHSTTSSAHQGALVTDIAAVNLGNEDRSVIDGNLAKQDTSCCWDCSCCSKCCLQ